MPRRLDPNRQRRPYRKLPAEPRNALEKRRPELFDGTGSDHLNIRERLFVMHWNANGGNAPQAARDAGYNVGKPDGWAKDGARHVSHYLLKRPAIQKALRDIQAETMRELGDVALSLRVRTLDVMMSDAKDRMVAARLLAEMTPGALVPKEVKVDAKMTYAEMVLAAQRKREGESAVVTGDMAEVPVLPDVEPAR